MDELFAVVVPTVIKVVTSDSSSQWPGVIGALGGAAIASVSAIAIANRKSRKSELEQIRRSQEGCYRDLFQLAEWLHDGVDDLLKRPEIETEFNHDEPPLKAELLLATVKTIASKNVVEKYRALIEARKKCFECYDSIYAMYEQAVSDGAEEALAPWDVTDLQPLVKNVKHAVERMVDAARRDLGLDEIYSTLVPV